MEHNQRKRRNVRKQTVYLTDVATEGKRKIFEEQYEM